MNSMCTCGHAKEDHGRADAQTAWQSLCWRDDCECGGYVDNDTPCWTCGGRGCEDCRSDGEHDISDPRFHLCDDCYSGCFVGHCRDLRCECPECGGLAEQPIRPADPRCPRCRNYPDTPGHFYGCQEESQ